MSRTLEEVNALEEFDADLRTIINKYKGQVLALDIIACLELCKFEQMYFVTQAKVNNYGNPNS